MGQRLPGLSQDWARMVIEGQNTALQGSLQADQIRLQGTMALARGIREGIAGFITRKKEGEEKEYRRGRDATQDQFERERIELAKGAHQQNFDEMFTRILFQRRQNASPEEVDKIDAMLQPILDRAERGRAAIGVGSQQQQPFTASKDWAAKSGAASTTFTATQGQPVEKISFADWAKKYNDG